MDPVQDARRKLIHIRYKFKDATPPPPPIVTPSPPERNGPVKDYLVNVVGTQIKRAVTLGIGFLVGAGILSATDGDAQGAAIAAVLSQFALTIVYALYDRFVKEYLLKLLGAASSK